MIRRALLAGLAAVLLPLAAAAADKPADKKAPFGDLGKDSDKPVHIGCDSQVLDYENETTTCQGARIEQGEMVLVAKTVVAAATDGKLTRITATGDVVITSRDATATAPEGVYDMAGRTIRLAGGTVVLTQGQNTLRGTELVIDLKAGTATLTGKGSASGRVDGVLQPGNAKSQ